MKKNYFELTELPYQVLSKFGLSREMIEDLPMRILKEICNGRHSPVLPVRVTDENGQTAESRTRFVCIRKDDGTTDVVFYPVLKSSPLEQYQPEQQKELLDGKAEELRLEPVEIKSMQHGDPLTLLVDDDTVTVGIDLTTPTGIRFCSGDGQKWKERDKREWDKYNFGCYGCWIMDEDGNLDYVPEEEYTEELWNEQKKSGERNRAAALHK